MLVNDQGEVYHSGAPRFLRQMVRTLRILDRRLARKTKGSRNREKMRVKRARLHEAIARCRALFGHTLSRKIVSENDRIALEDLNVKGMMRNKRLARSVADAGLGSLHEKIEYKATWHVRELARCDRWFASSKTCSVCGHVHKELKLSERQWKCPSCGTVHHRDRNAGHNIRVECFPDSNKHAYPTGGVLNECGAGVDPEGRHHVPAGGSLRSTASNAPSSAGLEPAR
ncbi:MAG: RNA-guided endonuclease TnpB family protein [Gammaproteobacteria bacterium]